MRITKSVDLGTQEVEVHIDGADVVAALYDDTEGWAPKQLVMRYFNNLGGLLNNLPQAAIDDLNDVQQQVIRDFLKGQLLRFRALSGDSRQNGEKP